MVTRPLLVLALLPLLACGGADASQGALFAAEGPGAQPASPVDPGADAAGSGVTIPAAPEPERGADAGDAGIDAGSAVAVVLDAGVDAEPSRDAGACWRNPQHDQLCAPVGVSYECSALLGDSGTYAGAPCVGSQPFPWVVCCPADAGT